MPTEAGFGQHHVFRIAGSADATPLKPNEHYLGVDAVSWFLNKQSSWFSDRMAAGTLDIKIAGGVEHYQAALGTFKLEHNSFTAPVFDRPVLPDRNYLGGVVTFSASLTAIKSDTVIAGLLKSAAAASIGVAAGMVQTATAAGPAQLLSAAGDEILKGVKNVLTDTGAKREPIFDFSGIEKNLTPDLIDGPATYILLHRGAEIDAASLNVRDVGVTSLPFLGDQPLNDGAWLLLRFRRSSVYSGQREWFGDVRALKGKVKALVSDFQSGVVEAAEALERLKPSSSGTNTLFDEFARLRAIIQNDGVLTETEASLYVGQLALAINSARKAVQSGTPAAFTAVLDEARTALLMNTPLPLASRASFEVQAQDLSDFRRGKLAPVSPEFGIRPMAAGGPTREAANLLPGPFVDGIALKAAIELAFEDVSAAAR